MENNDVISVLLPVERANEARAVIESLNQYLIRNKEIILLHVLDTGILEHMKEYNAQQRDDYISHLKVTIESQFKEDLSGIPNNEDIHTMIVEGISYIEIIKIARDLKVDLIAMKIRSRHNDLEKLLFGTTTERVLRGSHLPVFCLP